MLYVSILTSDRSQDPELWATIWQGNPPPSINLIGAYNLGNDKRVFIWEGEELADIQFMDRFNEVGVLETSPAFDRSAGWRCAFAKDIDTFREGLRRAGREQQEAAVDLRTRGMNAPNRHAARAAARAWTEEQENK
ncbi:MAG: hypothetical protein QF898_20360 [SAR202 cluster bacterium]|jgi:hypothetical protein|nr:hypothetical protein [SAR202 cluster bacterium]MDP6714365.1 hypothetical protein [SAR202 cluster bacterium]